MAMLMQGDYQTVKFLFFIQAKGIKLYVSCNNNNNNKKKFNNSFKFQVLRLYKTEELKCKKNKTVCAFNYYVESINTSLLVYVNTKQPCLTLMSSHLIMSLLNLGGVLLIKNRPNFSCSYFLHTSP